jgi:hypothetical protein
MVQSSLNCRQAAGLAQEGCQAADRHEIVGQPAVMERRVEPAGRVEHKMPL